jgi:hypothetical protein
MSLDSYLEALGASARLPEPIRAEATRPERYDSYNFRGTDAYGRVESIVKQLEDFNEEAPTSTLAERSVLTLVGLADVRIGVRLLIAARAVDDQGGIAALASEPNGMELSNLLFADDEDTRAIIAAIRNAADYKPDRGSHGSPQADPVAFQKDIQRHVDEVLRAGSGAIGDLARVVAGHAVGHAAAALHDAFAGVLAAGGPYGLLGWLTAEAMRAVRAGVQALLKAVGPDAADGFAASIPVVTKFLGDLVSVKTLGGLVDAHSVAPECVKLLVDERWTRSKADAAVRAADKVAGHAKHLSDVTGKVTKPIILFGGLIWATPVGPWVLAGALAAIVAAVWQVEDHLSTAHAFPRRRITEGMIMAVNMA